MVRRVPKISDDPFSREFSGDIFVYDKSTDTYLCPEGEEIPLSA